MSVNFSTCCQHHAVCSLPCAMHYAMQLTDREAYLFVKSMAQRGLIVIYTFLGPRESMGMSLICICKEEDVKECECSGNG